jgi:hypothetical protein
VRLVISLLGVEVFAVETQTGPPPPPSEADGVEITRHSGLFDLGFQPATRWSAVERDEPGP